ncbi:MAG: tetratricopeptide repeat protein [Treponema sp.]|jgi:tetratricopeptide (TPR) repeat protein|nr:tetratricopeptide repeat protein [Treponema sp.]
MIDVKRILVGCALFVGIIIPGFLSCVSALASYDETSPPALPGSEGEGEQTQEAVEPQPVDIWAILAKVMELLEAGDYDGALGCFDEVDPIIAESSRALILKASILSSAGRLGESRTIIEGVISQEPRNTDALLVLATIEGAVGKEREQRAILERILTVDPAKVEALISLGTIALRDRSLRAAASYFDRALAAEPENGDALVGKALVFWYNQDPQNAEALLNKAITLYPQWAVPLSERARIYRNTGYFKYALADMDAAKELNPGNYWIAIDRGNVLLDLKKKREALEEFNRAIQLDPNNFLAYVYSAGIKDDFKDYDGAEQDYIILARLRPDYYFGFEGVGMHHMRKGRWAEARDAFLEAYKQAPQETTYALLAAMNWMRAGKITDPKPLLEQAMRQAPRDSVEWPILRLYRDLSGDSDMAARVEKETNLEVKARMLYYLANYYDIRKNKTLANSYFVQVKDLNQQHIVEWRLNEWVLEERNLGGTW